MSQSSQTLAGPLTPARFGQSTCVMLIVIGLDEPDTAEVVKQVQRSQEENEPHPVFVTDLDHFQIFTAERLVFEHLSSPRSQSLAPAGLAWSRYVHRRLDLLVAKWQPATIIPFGSNARDMLRAWRQERIRSE